MTKYKINLVEATDEIKYDCYYGRPEDYMDFEGELSWLVQLLNMNIEGIHCEIDSNSNTSIVIESEINTTSGLLERIKPEFSRRFCYINYDIKNPITKI